MLTFEKLRVFAAALIMAPPLLIAAPLGASADTACGTSNSAGSIAAGDVKVAPGPGIVDITGVVTDEVAPAMTCSNEGPIRTDGAKSAVSELTAEQLSAYLAVWLNSTYNSGMPNCQSFSIDVAGYAGRCLTAGPTAPASPSATPAPGPTRQQAENLVINLIARLDIPDPQIQIGPEPSLNEWNMAVVGMPYWLWTTEAATKATSVTISGYTITMTAHRESVAFDPGDGTAAITCTDMRAWTQDMLMEPSTGCGHTFTQRNEQGVNYTMRARAHWVIDWTALGYSGTLRLQTTATRSIHVGELQSVVVAVGQAATGG